MARSAAASTPPSFHEVQRLQELEAKVGGLQVACDELRRRSAAWVANMQERQTAMESRMEAQDEAVQRLQEAAQEQGRHDGGWRRWNS